MHFVGLDAEWRAVSETFHNQLGEPDIGEYEEVVEDLEEPPWSENWVDDGSTGGSCPWTWHDRWEESEYEEATEETDERSWSENSRCTCWRESCDEGKDDALDDRILGRQLGVKTMTGMVM